MEGGGGATYPPLLRPVPHRGYNEIHIPLQNLEILLEVCYNNDTENLTYRLKSMLNIAHLYSGLRRLESYMWSAAPQ